MWARSAKLSGAHGPDGPRACLIWRGHWCHAIEIWPSIGPVRWTRLRRTTAVDERTSTSKDRRPRGAARMLGRGAALLCAASVAVLLAGGVGATMAVQPG